MENETKFIFSQKIVSKEKVCLVTKFTWLTSS